MGMQLYGEYTLNSGDCNGNNDENKLVNTDFFPCTALEPPQGLWRRCCNVRSDTAVQETEMEQLKSHTARIGT